MKARFSIVVYRGSREVARIRRAVTYGRYGLKLINYRCNHYRLQEQPDYYKRERLGERWFIDLNEAVAPEFLHNPTRTS